MPFNIVNAFIDHLPKIGSKQFANGFEEIFRICKVDDKNKSLLICRRFEMCQSKMNFKF